MMRSASSASGRTPRWTCMSHNPGITKRPRPSTTVAPAGGFASGCSTAVMVAPVISRERRAGGAPVPSITVASATTIDPDGGSGAGWSARNAAARMASLEGTAYSDVPSRLGAGKRLDWVEPHCAPRRHEARKDGDERQDGSDRREGHGVGRRDLDDERLEHRGHTPRAEEAECDADR